MRCTEEVPMARCYVNSYHQMVGQYEDGDSETNCFRDGGRAIVPRADDRGASKLAVFLLLTALALTGCAAMRGGAGADEVAIAVARERSLTGVKVTHREVAQTFGPTTIVVLTADQPRDAVTDLSVFTEGLLGSVYSADDWKPTAGIRIVLRGFDGATLGAALEQSGWKVVGWEESDPGTVFVPFSELQERYGEWPSKSNPQDDARLVGDTRGAKRHAAMAQQHGWAHASDDITDCVGTDGTKVSVNDSGVRSIT